ncbi:DMT family transporter, partial [Saccharomonospora saliphila]|uniref:DMT family transporter n=1 Tax=Saccharomonospora saliphila TaxID=369829 RepID=UPI000378D8CA
MLTVLLAALAALANALASVLQRIGARRQPYARPFSPALVWDLAHQPPWLAGTGAMLAGFALQVAALSTGPIAMVQPILVAELGFTLLLSSVLMRASLHRREVTAVVGMIVGIAVLLVALRPAGGSTRAVTGPTWLLGCGFTLAVIAALVLVARRYRHALRAAFLGVASGLFFGFLAVLVAGVTGAFAGGVPAVLGAWQTWAVLVAGPAGFLLLQATLRAGSLVASQPGLTL